MRFQSFGGPQAQSHRLQNTVNEKTAGAEEVALEGAEVLREHAAECVGVEALAVEVEAAAEALLEDTKLGALRRQEPKSLSTRSSQLQNKPEAQASIS